MMAKLGPVGADAVVLDLEDAVPYAEKETARRAVRDSAAELRSRHPGQATYVRVNAIGSPWIAADIAEAMAPDLDGIVLPKLEEGDQVEWAVSQLDRSGFRDGVIVGGIETALGVERAPEFAHPRLVGVYFGAEDYIADLGGERTAGGHEVAYARSRVAMAARLLGVPAVDQVVVEIKNDVRYTTEAVEARQLGYSGKMCIHPAQVRLAHRVFSPTDQEVDRARRLLAAAEQGARDGRGVVLFEGQMIDAPVIRHAERILERAGDETKESR
jgi:citrate lyase subunit beta / citryl-CoA lyase